VSDRRRRVDLSVDKHVQDASRRIARAAKSGQISDRRAEMLSGTILMACYGDYELSARQYRRRREWLEELGIDLDALIETQLSLID
jgi:hypothetical protein